MVYPMPENVTGIGGMFNYADVVTGDKFAITMLLSLYIIVLVYSLVQQQMKGDTKWEKSALVAGFIFAVSIILLRFAGIDSLAQDSYIFYGVASVIIPLVISYLKDSSS